MSEERKITLVPDGQASPDEVAIPLDRLPGDTDLISDPPSPSLVASIRSVGILEPIVCLADGDGYRVACGRRRVKAARAAGLETVPARVYPDGWIRPEVLSLIENRQRSNNLYGDMLAVEALMKIGADPQEIMKATGLKKAQYDQARRITRLIPPLRKALERGQLRDNIADRAARLGERQWDLVPLVDRVKENGEFETIKFKDVKQVSLARQTEAVASGGLDALFSTPDTARAIGGGDWKRKLRDVALRTPDDAPRSVREALAVLLHYAGANEEQTEDRDGPEAKAA